MIIATIGALLAGKFQVIFEEPGIANSFVIRDIDMADVSSMWFKQHCIYLVRDEQTTFYIGQSRKNILQRVGSHIGLNSFNLTSTPHRFFQANMPQSLNWYILFFTMEDCLKDLIIGGTDENQGLTLFERAHNLSPSSIPAGYRIPHSELPDGIVCTFEGPRYEFTVSYQAYDYAHQQNKTYTIKIYACSYKECRNAVIQLLGFEPDFLYVHKEESSSDGVDDPLFIEDERSDESVLGEPIFQLDHEASSIDSEEQPSKDRDP